MATYPIKVLLDRNRQPFIPFATTSSIVENGTNRRLDKMLGNLDDLQTNNKNSLVSAINEILTQHGGGGSSTGWQVVDKLPTENISATTIYLVPKEGAKKPNIYEEWIWVNDDWENIGTTEIDLSGYATTTMIGDLNTLQTTDKDCIVDAINEIVGTAGGTSANIGTLSALSTYDKSSVVSAINEVNNNVKIFYKFSTTEEWQNIIDALKQGKKAILISKSKAGNTSTGAFDDVTYYSPDTSTIDWDTFSGYLNFKSDWWMTSYVDHFRNNRVGLIPKWSVIQVQVSPGGVVMRTQVSTSSHNNIANVVSYLNVLGKTNTEEYTPTANYHPATKKYVDDTVAAAGAGSGSAFDPAKYLAIDNTTEYTPTDLYHPATKAYVDGLIASVPEPVDAYSKTEVDGKLANYLSKTNTESYTPTSDYHPATKKFVESVVASIPGPDLSGYYTKGEVDDAINNIEFPTTDLSGYYTRAEVNNMVKTINNRASKFASLSIGAFNAASSLTGTKVELRPSTSGDYCYGNGLFTAQPDSNAMFKFTGVKKLKLTIAANTMYSSELGITIMRQDVGSTGFIIDRFGAERTISEETYNNHSLYFYFKDGTEEASLNRQEQSFVLTGLNPSYTYRFVNTAYAYGKTPSKTSVLSNIDITAEVIE